MRIMKLYGDCAFYEKKIFAKCQKNQVKEIHLFLLFYNIIICFYVNYKMYRKKILYDLKEMETINIY